MLPTLNGRIQTRIFLLVVVGGLLGAAHHAAPARRRDPRRPLPGDVHRPRHRRWCSASVWELLYHLLQQFRWEKDWPTLFGLLVGIPEGCWRTPSPAAGCCPRPRTSPPEAFIVGFGTTWLVTWLFVSGPMRVLSVHWRFRGGRLV